jgi:hypothetical protein
MHLVPVIQPEIEIARTRLHQLLRRQSHLPECMLPKTLSNFKYRHKVVEIFNKMCRQKCIWFLSSNLKSKSREHVANSVAKLLYMLLSLLQSNNKMLSKMHLVPVIQPEIEIARTRLHQLLRRQSHSPECMLSKTLSNFKYRHEVVEIFNKMCRQNCIWFQSSNLKTETARQRCM